MRFFKYSDAAITFLVVKIIYVLKRIVDPVNQQGVLKEWHLTVTRREKGNKKYDV